MEASAGVRRSSAPAAGCRNRCGPVRRGRRSRRPGGRSARSARRRRRRSCRSAPSSRCPRAARPHLAVGDGGDHAVAVELDLVQPLLALGRLGGERVRAAAPRTPAASTCAVPSPMPAPALALACLGSTPGSRRSSRSRPCRGRSRTRRRPQCDGVCIQSAVSSRSLTSSQFSRVSLPRGLERTSANPPLRRSPSRSNFRCLRQALARVAARRPRPAVPDHDGSAAVFALRDRALEGAVLERVVLGAYGEPLLGRVEAGAARHRPALQHAVELGPEIEVQPARAVLLDHERAALPARADPALRLGGAREVALLVIGLERRGAAGGHDGEPETGSADQKTPGSPRVAAQRRGPQAPSALGSVRLVLAHLPAQSLARVGRQPHQPRDAQRRQQGDADEGGRNRPLQGWRARARPRRAQDDGPDRHPEADGDLLGDAGKASRCARLLRLDIGVGDRVQARELQRPEQPGRDGTADMTRCGVAGRRGRPPRSSPRPRCRSRRARGGSRTRQHRAAGGFMASAPIAPAKVMRPEVSAS